MTLSNSNSRIQVGNYNKIVSIQQGHSREHNWSHLGATIELNNQMTITDLKLL